MSLTPDEIAALARAIATTLLREIPALAQPNEIVAPLPGIERLHVGAIEIDVARHEVLVDDVETSLAPREFATLTALARNAGRVLSREQLLELAWPEDAALEIENTRNVDVIVRRLRLKLGGSAKQLQTVHGAGYKLRNK